MRLIREKKLKTVIVGLIQPPDQLKKTLKVLKKTVTHSNGSISEGDIIMQGDSRKEIKKYLIEELGIRSELIEEHGV